MKKSKGKIASSKIFKKGKMSPLSKVYGYEREADIQTDRKTETRKESER